MENVLFVQDFPLHDVPTASSENLLPFASVLYNFLDEMGVPRQVCDKLLDYDFQRAKVRKRSETSGRRLKLFNEIYLAAF
jgi:hypothetical protein